MRKFILLICYFGFSLIAFAQTGNAFETIYYNNNWKECKKDSASYYRHYYKKDGKWVVKDYYITNTLQMTGTYIDDSMTIKDGAFVYYYEEGQKSSEGNFVNNKAEGLWTSWYKNGQTDGIGVYANGDYSGVWKWYYDDGKLSAEEEYEQDGKLIKIKAWKADGTLNEAIKADEQMPEYIGGVEEMIKFLQKNVKYPKTARRKGIEGRVLVQFVVTNDGSITDAEVIKSVCEEIDNEALRVVNAMQKWTPGYQHGRPVYVKFNLPISFKLN